MTDTELQALTALVNAETMRQHVQLETGGRLIYAPDYRAETALQLEMGRRGIVVDPPSKPEREEVEFG